MWNGRAGRGLRTGGVGAGRWLRTGGVRAEGAENGGCQNLGGLRIENWEGPQAPEGGSVIQITQFTTGGPGSQTRKTGFSRGSAPWGPPLLGAVPPCPAPPPRGLQAPGQVGSLPWADGLTAPVLTHGLSMGLLGSLRGWRLLDYKTEKYVLTRNWWVGALQRVLQLGILGYVIGWSLLLQKGYQEKESDPRVSVITKLKGVSVAQMEALGSRVWDVADYTKPPQGENVFFLVTNFLATPGQVQGKCPEHPSVPLAPCLADEDCPAGETLSHSHGIKTGKCVPFNSSYQTCEIWGWCPVESGPVPRANTLETRDGGYFKRCRYHALASPLCPVFRVGDVVAAAGGDFEDLALLGGVVRIQITWDCDLDRPGSECQPRYSFWLQEKGHNFRAAVRWWRPPGREARSLFKLFGIRFEILVAGQAGKFSVIATGITLGTGMALLGAATFLCDLLLLYVDRQAPFYWGEKYEEAKAPKGKGGPESTRASALGGRETPGRSRGTAGQAAGEGGPEAARRSPPNDGAAPRGLQGCDSFLESPRTHWETP
ncbi:P2X purinoceptor 6 isoform X8 [Antechinus flavipes]|uniref:P2X purinoceptor 6 isoform X8 n=1 Tax=Antechinus flavipes TaxID=38775 RepID=UPI0022354D67|nr:P2X purinoceptor 6 isoform X8 [Antechinus flavipes]